MQAKENYIEYIRIREFPEFPPIGLKSSFLTVLSDTGGIFSYVPFLKCREKTERPDAALHTQREWPIGSGENLAASASPDWRGRTGTFRRRYPWTKSGSTEGHELGTSFGGSENSGAKVWGREKAQRI